uniref:Tripartite motif-containing protein 2 n=1 Tax=Magallana gigas TaxID=29159 RepID=K1PV05_MAGGI
MDSNDAKQSKVVRYAGAIKKQAIQFNEKGERLYSSSSFKYICENKNLDICVADKVENAVVVVSHSGLLRFIYTGHSSQMSFTPVGIATDSTCLILVVDHDHQIIHAVNQDGQFIGYIENCNLQSPWGIYVDSKDRLFVAESLTGQLSRLYLKYQCVLHDELDLSTGVLSYLALENSIRFSHQWSCFSSVYPSKLKLRMKETN